MSQGGAQIDLDTSLGYLLKQGASALRTSMDAALRPLGMSVPQYSCLEQLAHRPGISNSELARGTFVSRQSMNVLLQALQRDGLVTRPEKADIGRALPIQLTELGRSKLTAASAAVKAVEQRMHHDLSESDQNDLRRLLRACVTALQTDDAG